MKSISVTGYLEKGPNSRRIQGTAEINGHNGTYQLDVTADDSATDNFAIRLHILFDFLCNIKVFKWNKLQHVSNHRAKRRKQRGRAYWWRCKSSKARNSRSQGSSEGRSTVLVDARQSEELPTLARNKPQAQAMRIAQRDEG